MPIGEFRALCRISGAEFHTYMYVVSVVKFLDLYGYLYIYTYEYGRSGHTLRRVRRDSWEDAGLHAAISTAQGSGAARSEVKIGDLA